MNKRITTIAMALFGLTTISTEAATYTVINTNDSGAGSLRQAINDANANPGTDFIHFNIPGAGTHTIFPMSPLPWLIGVASVDGASQPGYAGTPLIEIGGDFAGVGAVGLQIFNNSSQVRGLTINGFSSHGIRISGSGGVTIVGCWIGINKFGTVSPTYPNGGDGVFIDNSPDNNIGGTAATLRNVISGNNGHGVRILGASAINNVIENNYIGLDVGDTAKLSNGGQGLRIEAAPSNTIGGSTAARNIISGNSDNNILLLNCPAPGNVIRGNYIGTNAAGSLVRGSGGPGTSGIEVNNSPFTAIGNAALGAGNLISGNGSHGIEVLSGSDGTTIHNNIIGPNATETVGFYKHSGGAVRLVNVCGVSVGGTFGQGNIISGNSSEAVEVDGTSGSVCGVPNVIARNLVGIVSSGAAMMNNGHGIIVKDQSNQIIEANWVANNGLVGIIVFSNPPVGPHATQIFITRNLIYDNGRIGIDLNEATSGSPDGVTLNDAGDVDTGANNVQNFPVLTSSSGNSVNTLNVIGTLNSLPFRSYHIELFGNDTCDPTGYGEGKYYLGFFDVITGATGDNNFNVIVATVRPFASDWLLTATATDNVTNDTSEFSACISIESDFCGPGNGSCYAAAGNLTPGCDNGDCCNLVCDVDPFCCDTAWDATCATIAIEICTNGGTENSGDCFTNNPSPGCYDLACVQTICEVDPFCCDVQWDQVCATQALTMCAAPCPGDIPFVTPGVVDVEDLLFLLAAWGETGPPRPRADLDPPPTGNNIVNVEDLLALLAAWGPCT
ncbi:MAG: right-handed parallel beta-helix repeat-containing protein [Planctomycetota bacterium]|nr:right-handed parallel beta-helix repeat-containing protein [Planctomycetota bacterium]